MVYLGASGEREEDRERHDKKLMAMATSERSRALHNFSFPCLKWGSQRVLRCMKVNDSPPAAAAAADDAIPYERRRSPAPFTLTRRPESGSEKRKRDSDNSTIFRANKKSSDGEEGIEAVREKLMNDLKTAADKMKDAILREEVPPAKKTILEGETDKSPAVAEEVRPWNLRTRRAACNVPAKGSNCSPVRNDGGGRKSAAEERVKFSVNLSKREIEEDYMAILGQRPPRRPKKRHRTVQKQLDSVFPGLWLTEVTPEIYKVPDVPESGKK